MNLHSRFPIIARLADQRVDEDPTTFPMTREAVKLFRELSKYVFDPDEIGTCCTGGHRKRGYCSTCPEWKPIPVLELQRKETK